MILLGLFVTPMNNWTPLRFLYSYAGQKYWLMRCICGTEKHISYGNYKAGKTTNCGCLRRKNRLVVNQSNEGVKHG